MQTPSINTSYNPGNIQNVYDNAQVEQNVQEVANKVAELLTSMGIESVIPQSGTTKDTKVSDTPFTAPTLEVEGDTDVNVTNSDLERLVAQLQADTSEKQLKSLEEELENSKSQLNTKYNEQMEKINESIADAKESENMSIWQKILGGLGCLLAIAGAVAATIFTGGVAAGFAIAGAVVAVATFVMDVSGGAEALTDLIADSLKANSNMNSAEAQAAAQAIYGAICLVLSLTCAIGGGVAGAKQAAKAVSSAVQATMKTANMVMNIANGVNGLISSATSIASLAINYNAANSAADVKDMEAELLKIQKQIEQNNDAIEEVLAKLNDAYTAMLEVINSTTDTSDQILQMTQQMA